MNDSPLFVLREARPMPRWRLVAALLLLLGTSAGLGVLFHLEPFQIPWRGGFVFLHEAVPGILALGAGAWAIRAWRQPDRRRWAFRGTLALALVQLSGVIAWEHLRQAHRDLNFGIYGSRVEYVSLAERPLDWPDPTHPETFEVGSGLRLAMSTVVWTDGLHRSLPRTTPPDPEPAPGADEPRPLSDLGARNLVALMKTCGLVRFFHPTDAAMAADWGRLVSQGVRQVEDAPTREELARRLQRLIAPYAPQVRLLLPGEPVPVLKPPPGAILLARWRHLGVGEEVLRRHATGATRDRSSRLAGVGLAWTTLEHFFPYWDVTPTSWASVLPTALREAAVAPTQEDYVLALRHLMAQLKDGHAAAYDLAVPALRGPEVDLEMVDGRPIVAQSWGSARGLPLGSEVLSVEGEPVEARMARLRTEISAATLGFMDGRVARALLTDRTKQNLEVEVRGPDGTRGLFPLAPRTQWWEGQPHPEAIRTLKPGILFVDLERMDEGDFRNALPQLVAARGLVFDLRGDPPSEAFLRHFRPGLLQGSRILLPVTCRPDGASRTYETRVHTIHSEQPYYRGKVVVLVGPFTGSHAELCLDQIASNHLAPTVGSVSTGTDGNFCAFWVPGGVKCQFTGTRVLRADGSRLQGLGIQPTVPVKHTREALAAGRDEDLERALALLESGG